MLGAAATVTGTGATCFAVFCEYQPDSMQMQNNQSSLHFTPGCMLLSFVGKQSSRGHDVNSIRAAESRKAPRGEGRRRW